MSTGGCDARVGGTRGLLLECNDVFWQASKNKKEARLAREQDL